VFRGFGQAKFADNGLIFCSSQFTAPAVSENDAQLKKSKLTQK